MIFLRNPIFWLGLFLVIFAVLYAWIGDPVTPQQFFGAISPPPLGADGRCTGFPNGIGRWQWGQCCTEHDLGGTDVTLVACLVGAVPPWAGPLCFGGVMLMGFCRPAYNVLQRWGWVK
jgi:hypothetical protein